ncbi:hypothetical protein Tco_1237372 [Tanacetum coccineum]
MASKFNNYWEIDKNTKNGLWEFYLNERTKGTIGDLDKYNEPCEENTTKTCSDTFYKPYLDAQEAKYIYEVIDRENSPIPIPARRDIDNPDDLCRTKEFTVVRHSIRDDEEFVTVCPSKINTVERTPGSMSCIYHELLNRKDRRWEEQYGDLAETMIWMEQYLQCIDYTLWEIIENGNAPIVTKTVDGKETVIPPTSVKEKAQRRA